MKFDTKALAWKGITIGVGAAAGAGVQQLMAFGWTKVAGSEPPKEAADRENSWTEAILWGVAAGVGFGVARVVAHRSAAAVWELATDETPPGVGTHAA